MNKTLKWYALNYDSNTMKPYTFNIFNHRYMIEDVPMLLKKCKTKKEFAKEFDNLLKYCYWSKSEHEMIISHWPPSDKDEGYKIDVYEQLKANIDNLVDYVWENKPRVLKTDTLVLEAYKHIKTGFSLDDAEELKKIIEEYQKCCRKVIVDFSKINVFTHTFFEALIGEYIRKNGYEIFNKKFSFINLNVVGKDSFDMVISYSEKI